MKITRISYQGGSLHKKEEKRGKKKKKDETCKTGNENYSNSVLHENSMEYHL